MADAAVREFLSGVDAGSTGGAPITRVTSSATAVGDMLVVMHGIDFYNNPAAMTAPTGTAGTWTQELFIDGGSNTAKLKIWTRSVTVGGAQTVTVPNTNDAGNFLCLWVISGDSLTIVDVDGQFPVTASVNLVLPAMTLDIAPAIQLAGFLCEPAGAVNHSYDTSGLTKDVELDAASFTTMSAGRASLVSAGAIPSRTVVSSTDIKAATAGIIIRSDAPSVTEKDSSDSVTIGDTSTVNAQDSLEDSLDIEDTATLIGSFSNADELGIVDSFDVTSVSIEYADSFAIGDDSGGSASIDTIDVIALDDSSALHGTLELTDSISVGDSNAPYGTLTLDESLAFVEFVDASDSTVTSHQLFESINVGESFGLAVFAEVAEGLEIAESPLLSVVVEYSDSVAISELWQGGGVDLETIPQVAGPFRIKIVEAGLPESDPVISIRKLNQGILRVTKGDL